MSSDQSGDLVFKCCDGWVNIWTTVFGLAFNRVVPCLTNTLVLAQNADDLLAKIDSDRIFDSLVRQVQYAGIFVNLWEIHDYRLSVERF
jgi:hypothetical protein